MQKIIILVGPPGSGKTSRANQILAEKSLDTEKWVRVNKDSLRSMMYNAFIDADEVVIHATMLAVLKNITTNVVLDNTNCRISNLKELIDSLSKQYHVELEFVRDELTDEQLIDINNGRFRNEKLNHTVLLSILQSYRHLIKHKEELLNYANVQNNKVKTSKSGHSYINNKPNGRPKAVIVDIDGTVAHMVDRSPFEWDKVGNDVPDYAIVELVQLLDEDYEIIFVSGRSDACREETNAWLDKNLDMGFYKLYMRKDGDFRKDAVIKKEIYDSFKDTYDVRFALDDRNQVVEFWRSIGVKCLQVEEGNF